MTQCPPHLVMVRNQIAQARKKSRRSHEIRAKVTQIILDFCASNGRFLRSHSKNFYFSQNESILFELTSEDLRFRYFLSCLGLNATERFFLSVVEDLNMYAYANGEEVEIFYFSHYCRQRNTLYVANGASRMLRITETAVDECHNGEDGVIFMASGESQFHFCAQRVNNKLIDDLLINVIPFSDSGKLTSDECRQLFRSWLLSLFFPERLPTRPIIAMIGEKGSGKSSSLRRVGHVLHGQEFNVIALPTDRKDFDAAVSNAHFVVFDNADSHVHWLAEALTIVATGGKAHRRALYTNNQLAQITYRAFVAITSRTPTFGRDDVADRLIVFMLNRIPFFTPEQDLLDFVWDNRDALMSALIYELQDVLRAFTATKDQKFPSTFRIADFADFVFRIATYKGNILQMQQVLDKVQAEQKEFATVGDDFVSTLSKWLENSNNVNRSISTYDLAAELNKVRLDSGMKDVQYNSANLGQKLSSRKSDLVLLFGMTFETRGGNQRYYKFNSGKNELSSTAGVGS